MGCSYPLGVVKAIVSKYPGTIRKTDAIGWTPLHYAALSGNLEATQMLMHGDNLISYISDESGMSALHVAAYAGHTKVMKEIIRLRPDTCHLVNDKGQTILHVAIIGGQEKVVKCILKMSNLGGLLNEADEDGNTPLHLAAIYRNVGITKILRNNRRVNSTAINKKLSMAVDIFHDDNLRLVSKKNRITYVT